MLHLFHERNADDTSMLSASRDNASPLLWGKCRQHVDAVCFAWQRLTDIMREIPTICQCCLARQGFTSITREMPTNCRCCLHSAAMLSLCHEGNADQYRCCHKWQCIASAKRVLLEMSVSLFFIFVWNANHFHMVCVFFDLCFFYLYYSQFMLVHRQHMLFQNPTILHGSKSMGCLKTPLSHLGRLSSTRGVFMMHCIAVSNSARSFN